MPNSAVGPDFGAHLAVPRAYNQLAIAKLGIRMDVDAMQAARDGSAYATWIIEHPSAKPDRVRAALVERVVASAIVGTEIAPDVMTLKSRSSGLQTLRDRLADYVSQIAANDRSVGVNGGALRKLRPALEQLEISLGTTELRDRGFPEGFSPMDLTILRSLNSPNWTEPHSVMSALSSIAHHTGLRQEAVSSALELLEQAGFVRRSDPEVELMPEMFGLTQPGHTALFRAELANRPPEITVA